MGPDVISGLLGGIGLFLLGMTLMTDGLKSAVGGVLRDLLARFTGGPVRAFISGTALTVLVQASSATVVMTIGFVSAGLLAFTQAIGVVFGAAVGTTSTSWLVAFFGLRYSISLVALPVVGIGALIRLFGRGRVASIGLALAGFGLMFVGIDTLQAGMEALSSRVQLNAIPGTTLAGRAILVAIGVAMTVVMQSSTAAVATTLAALHSGTIDLTHAAALVIGHNVGTVVTAAIASIGASVLARRTALAFILLNVFSGFLAFVMLPLYLGVFDEVSAATDLGPAPMIALFHTAINLVGVAFLLPITDRYAALITRLVPERTPALTRYLDTTLLAVPSVAIESARRTVVEIGTALVGMTRVVLDGRDPRRFYPEMMETAAAAAAETRAFLGRIRSSPGDEQEYQRHLATLHASDHFDRLLEALHDAPSAMTLNSDPTLKEVAGAASAGLIGSLRWLETGGADEDAPHLESLSREIAERRRLHRPTILARTAAGEVLPNVSLEALDAMRWVDRAVYHIWRATYHLTPSDRHNDDTHEVFEDAPTNYEHQAVIDREGSD